MSKWIKGHMKDRKTQVVSQELGHIDVFTSAIKNKNKDKKMFLQVFSF